MKDLGTFALDSWNNWGDTFVSCICKWWDFQVFTGYKTWVLSTFRFLNTLGTIRKEKGARCCSLSCFLRLNVVGLVFLFAECLSCMISPAAQVEGTLAIAGPLKCKCRCVLRIWYQGLIFLKYRVSFLVFNSVSSILVESMNVSHSFFLMCSCFCVTIQFPQMA